MPEIRIGSSENMRNINLGSIELQEIYLGTTLIWQNNQGPVIGNITFNGMSLSANIDGEIDATSTAFAGLYGGTNTTYNVVFNNVSDPDYVAQAADGVPLAERDLLVGFRVQRPDGTWLFGDPDTNEFGQLFTTSNGVASDVTYNSVTGTFTNAIDQAATSTFNFPITFRDINAATSTVDSIDSIAGLFADQGEWRFIVVDSRGGDTPMAVIDISLSYQAPNGTTSGGGEGFASGSTNVVTYNPTGGPTTIQWGSSSNSTGPFTPIVGQITPTISVTTSPFSSPVYYSPELTGRSWSGNAAPAAAYITPGQAVNHDTFVTGTARISTGPWTTSSTTVVTPCNAPAAPATCDCGLMNCTGASGVEAVTLNQQRTIVNGTRCVNQRTNAIAADASCPGFVTNTGTDVSTTEMRNVPANSTCSNSAPNPAYVDPSTITAVFVSATEISAGTRNAGTTTNSSSFRVDYTRTPTHNCPSADTIGNFPITATCGTCTATSTTQWQNFAGQPSAGDVTGFVTVGTAGMPCAEPVGTPCTFS